MELDPKTTKKILFFIAFGAVCFAAAANSKGFYRRWAE